jgi:L-fucose isomerase
MAINIFMGGNIMAVRIGLITMADPRVRDEVYKIYSKYNLDTIIEDNQIEFINYKKVVCYDYEAVQAMKELKDRDVDCIICHVAWFMRSDIIITGYQATGVPIIVWSLPDKDTTALIGAGVVHGSLEEVGIDHKFVYKKPGKEATEEIKSFALAAKARKKLWGSKYCQIGGRSLSMYTGVVDPSQWKYMFGVEVEHMDQWTLYLEAEKIDEKRVTPVIEKIRNEYGEICVNDDSLQKSVRMYLAMKDMFDNNMFDFAGVKCQFELIDNYIAPCLSIAMLNDELKIVACEADMNAALSMYVLSTMSGTPAMFADTSWLDVEQGIMRLLNCGAAPTYFAGGKDKIRLSDMPVTMGGYDEEKKTHMTKGGVCTGYLTRSGEVTLARFSRIKGKYVLNAIKGKAYDPGPRNSYLESQEGLAGDRWPWTYVKLEGDTNKFVQNLRANHIHMVYGNYLDALKEFCYLTKVELV